MVSAAEIFLGIGLVFFALAKLHARPGFSALAVGIFVILIPGLSPRLPGQGDGRDLLAFVLLLVAASAGTALGGGLKPEAHDHDHDHGHDHTH